jgi:hypothetical protein
VVEEKEVLAEEVYHINKCISRYVVTAVPLTTSKYPNIVNKNDLRIDSIPDIVTTTFIDVVNGIFEKIKHSLTQHYETDLKNPELSLTNNCK